MQKRLIWIQFGMAVLLLTPALSRGQVSNPAHTKQNARNVILFVGEGMGLSQISAAIYSNHNHLELERFPVTGLQKAYTLDNLSSDPVASATTLASGHKTNVGRVWAPQGKKQARTLIQEAESRGMATGLFVNMDLTDAFPLAFLGGVQDFSDRVQAAKAYLGIDMDLLIGGGRQHFTGDSTGSPIQKFQEKGYQVSDYASVEFPKITLDLKRNALFFLSEGSDSTWSHAAEKYMAAVRLAALFLKKHNSKGFLLVVGLDQGHAAGRDPSQQLVSDILAFDRILGALLDFAEEDGETLLVVTSGHEQGGFAINPGSQMDTLLTEFNTGRPTAIMLPVFAYGPGSNGFSGMYENVAIHKYIRKALGWE
jgi:alkaline phosphatase